jgi:hypothetical protein
LIAACFLARSGYVTGLSAAGGKLKIGLSFPDFGTALGAILALCRKKLERAPAGRYNLPPRGGV